MEEIEKKTGAPTMYFGYLPEGMKYQGYEIADGLDAAVFYQYLDRIFYLTIMGVDKEGTHYYTYDSDAAFRKTVVNMTGIEAKIWEVNLENEEEVYIAQIEHEGWRYMLNGMISLEEMQNIIEHTVFL